MDIPFSIILLILALFISFLNGVVASLTADEIQSLTNINSKKSELLKKAYNNYEDNYNGFHLFEIIFSIFSLIFFLNYLNTVSNLGDYQFQFTFLIIIIYYYLRIVVFSFGERKSNRFALKFSKLIYFINVITNPLISVLNTTTRQIKGVSETEESINELNELFETAREEGSLDAEEYRLLKNIMSFSDVLVMDVMTPRTVVFSLNAEKTIEEVITNAGLQTFSRFPIWEGETLDDKIVGYVLSKDVFQAALNGNKDKKLKEFARDVYIIPETADLSVALEKFLKRRQHLFIAVDEYGGVSGLITMEDVLETILGVEILDEADKITDLRKLAVEKRDNRVKMKITGNL